MCFVPDFNGRKLGSSKVAFDVFDNDENHLCWSSGKLFAYVMLCIHVSRDMSISRPRSTCKSHGNLNIAGHVILDFAGL